MDVKLIMFREAGDRRDFPLNHPEITIGRKDDCDIRVPLAEVSRHHAKLTVAKGKLSVKDLGSANGTFVNNKKINSPQPLNAGDHLVVGPVVFTVQIDGVPDNIRAVKTKLRSMSTTAKSASRSGDSAAGRRGPSGEDEVDPISALEALASSTDQTAIDAFDAEEEVA
ncbi:MAG: FHA domain-containing protein [Phycisphaerales bacterium]|nr:FHA domain-containing protein [Phycisphaerales bacterium]